MHPRNDSERWSAVDDRSSGRGDELTTLEAVSERVSAPRNHAALDSLRIVALYGVVGIVWFYLVEWATGMMGLSPMTRATVTFLGGLTFVLVSSVVGYLIGFGHLWRIYQAQARIAEAERHIRAKDIAIRQAYVDVLDAVTGGKLVLMTTEEVGLAVGAPVFAPKRMAEPGDVAAARQVLGEVLAPLTPRADDIVLAVSEALTNVLKHAYGGEYWVARKADCLQIVVRDSGAGIDFHTLPKATLAPGFSTKQSLGMGFTIMLQLTDRLLLATDESGTTLVLEFDLLGKEEDPSEAAEESWADLVAAAKEAGG
jgi:anti-sigma regulatory factor (Ser/Thr protein kinase)